MSLYYIIIIILQYFPLLSPRSDDPTPCMDDHLHPSRGGSTHTMNTV